MEPLREVRVQDTYILRIEARPRQLDIEGDFALEPEHPEYRDPTPDEAFCFRRGVLMFEGVTRIEWSDQGRPPAIDAAGEIDYGEFDSVAIEGEALILAGDFGRIAVESESLQLVFSDPAG
jgi:hypothetical protein